MNNVKLMSVKNLEEELTEMEDSYSTAFMEETSASVLQVIWERIRELREEIEERTECAKQFSHSMEN